MVRNRFYALLSAAVAFILVVCAPSLASSSNAPNSESYTVAEVTAAGHRFFGSVSGGLATIIERLAADYGQPNGYILGEEASGSFVGGLRYGEGELFTHYGSARPVFWQGPTVGWDFGGEGARTMMLVYNLPNTDAMYRRFSGVDGSAYLVGGLGVTILQARDVVIVPVRSGVGARLGVNVGYLKFTRRPTWNPF